VQVSATAAVQHHCALVQITAVLSCVMNVLPCPALVFPVLFSQHTAHHASMTAPPATLLHPKCAPPMTTVQEEEEVLPALMARRTRQHSANVGVRPLLLASSSSSRQQQQPGVQ
jgi:hypothetical protein